MLLIHIRWPAATSLVHWLLHWYTVYFSILEIGIFSKCHIWNAPIIIALWLIMRRNYLYCKPGFSRTSSVLPLVIVLQYFFYSQLFFFFHLGIDWPNHSYLLNVLHVGVIYQNMHYTWNLLQVSHYIPSLLHCAYLFVSNCLTVWSSHLKCILQMLFYSNNVECHSFKWVKKKQ